MIRHSPFLKLVFLLCCCLPFTSTLSAQGYSKCYKVWPERIPDILDSLSVNYPTRFAIPSHRVEAFLENQLEKRSSISNELRAPNPGMTGYSNPVVLFRWADIPVVAEENFQVSRINLQWEEPIVEEEETRDLGAIIHHKPNSFNHLWLYSFSTLENDAQSILTIIIIDKDVAFTCEEEIITIPPFLRNTSSTKNQTQASIQHFPNPFLDQATLSFNLPEDGQVSIHLYEMTTGRLLSSPLENVDVKKGRQEFSGQWQKLPAGQYICTLVYDGQTYPSRLVKLRD